MLLRMLDRQCPYRRSKLLKTDAETFPATKFAMMMQTLRPSLGWCNSKSITIRLEHRGSVPQAGVKLSMYRESCYHVADSSVLFVYVSLSAVAGKVIKQ